MVWRLLALGRLEIESRPWFLPFRIFSTSTSSQHLPFVVISCTAVAAAFVALTRLSDPSSSSVVEPIGRQLHFFPALFCASGFELQLSFISLRNKYSIQSHHHVNATPNTFKTFSSDSIKQPCCQSSLSLSWLLPPSLPNLRRPSLPWAPNSLPS